MKITPGEEQNREHCEAVVRVLLVRNAEAKANVETRFCRSSHLTDTGRLQAKRLADFLLRFQPQAVWSSPLDHAYETAEIVANTFNLGVGTIDGIANLETGEWEGLTAADIARQWPDEWRKLRNGTVRPEELLVPGGETLESFHHRVVSAFTGFARSLSEDVSVCVVAHNMSVAAILADLVGAPCQGLFCFEQYNAALNLIEIREGPPRVVFTNYVGFATEAGLSIRPGALSGAPS